MPEIGAALVGALALLGIPTITWLSKRATREGRLLLRLERLGAAYAVIPDSRERQAFKTHLTAVVNDLNAWLDLDKTKTRRYVRAVWVVTVLAGCAAALMTAPLIERAYYPWLGVILGFAMSAVTQLGTYLIERRARVKAAAADVARSERRLEALKRGEPLES